MSHHPRRKKRNAASEGPHDHLGPPSPQEGEPNQPRSLEAQDTARGDFSQPRECDADGNNQMNARLRIGSAKTSPVEDDDPETDAEENSEPGGSCCEAFEEEMVYLPVAAHDSKAKDPDWVPARMRKKKKPKTEGPTRRGPYKKGPDVMSKSERTQRRYRKAWKDQKRLDDFFATRATIPRKRSPSVTLIADDGSDGDDDAEIMLQPEVSVGEGLLIVAPTAAPTHPDSDS